MIYELRDAGGAVLYSGPARPEYSAGTKQWVTPTLVVNVGALSVVLVEVAAPAAPAPANPTEWLIDVGPFMDRFSTAKMAVLTSSDALVKAIMQDMFARKWIDLRRVDVGQAIDAIGAKVPSVTPALRATILTSPVSAEENLALRKLYFS